MRHSAARRRALQHSPGSTPGADLANPIAVRPFVDIFITAADRDAANALADALKVAGHNVCSLWHRMPAFITLSPSEARELRLQGRQHMRAHADVVVRVGDGDDGGDSEWAKTVGKRVVTVGDGECSGADRVKDAEELLAWLMEMQAKATAPKLPTHIRPTCAKPAKLISG